MSLINEISKLKESAGAGGGGTLGHFAEPNLTDPVVALQYLTAGSSDYTTSSSYYVQSSSVYRRVFNHGGGQFSIASKHYMTSTNTAQLFCQPFTVNQTTGAISVGSGSAIFNGNSNIDTGTFSQIGNYVMSQSTSGSSGNMTRAWTVSGNSVSGNASYTSNAQYFQPMSNNDAAAYRSGSTMYMYPQVYYTSNGRQHRVSVGYNGSSVFGQEGPSDPGSNTSTHYTWPVVPQHGQSGPTTGAGIRCWTRSSPSGLTMMDVLNTSGSYSSEVNPQTLGIGFQNSPTEGYGIELSNGRQLFYCDYGAIILNNGGTLSNVTGSADYIPKSFDNFISEIAPGGATDTWICISSGEYKEIVKFYVNPTTYKITILGSVPLFKFLKGNLHDNPYSHISMTGSSNQFIVHGRTYEGTPGARITVFNNPFVV